MQKLKGKVVLVTGGAQGIGAAIAKLFAQHGASVVVADMNVSAGLGTMMSINAEVGSEGGGGAVFRILDVTNLASIDTCVSYMIEVFGRIDILVNNAGITRDKMFLKMSRESFMDVLTVNLVGLNDMTRAVAPHMVAQGSGVILNASSVVAVNGNVGQSNYATTKAAVESLTQTLARELGRKGIRVNAVAPGFTDTDMTKAMPEEARLAVFKNIPLGRFATPEEIADAYLYLSTASYVTGTTLSVSGGLVV